MESSKRDLAALAPEAKQILTYGIYLAELGAPPRRQTIDDIDAEEIVCDYHTDTYDAVYALSLDDWVYVLHCFKKKSKRGRETPKPDINRITPRLKDARILHKKEGRDKARTE